MLEINCGIEIFVPAGIKAVLNDAGRDGATAGGSSKGGAWGSSAGGAGGGAGGSPAPSAGAASFHEEDPQSGEGSLDIIIYIYIYLIQGTPWGFLDPMSAWPFLLVGPIMVRCSLLSSVFEVCLAFIFWKIYRQETAVFRGAVCLGLRSSLTVILACPPTSGLLHRSIGAIH